MSSLSPEEMKKYNELTAEAKRRQLTPPEYTEWNELGKRYAIQLEREGQEHRARRAEQMEQFLAEKKAWADERDANEAAKAKARAEYEGDPDSFVWAEFDKSEPTRDFNTWLKQKGFA